MENHLRRGREGGKVNRKSRKAVCRHGDDKPRPSTVLSFPDYCFSETLSDFSPPLHLKKVMAHFLPDILSLN